MAKPLDNDAAYWRAFDQTRVTHSAAHYLMAIHGLHKEFGYARATDVAAKLEVSRGAASLALAQLKKRDLVEEDAHRILLLTEDGHRIVHEIERNFAVLAAFFQNILGASQEAAHADACKMEHLLSLETGRRLVNLMRMVMEDPVQTERVRHALALSETGDNDWLHCPICGGGLEGMESRQAHEQKTNRETVHD